MSLITGMVLVTFTEEREAVERLNAWCRSHEEQRGLRAQTFGRLDERAAGGLKAFGGHVWVMAGNYFPWRELVEVLPTFGWHLPDNVLLLVDHDHEDEPLVFRGDGRSAAWEPAEQPASLASRILTRDLQRDVDLQHAAQTAEQPEPAPSPEDVADRPCPRCGGPAITHYADASTPAEPFALVPSRIECRDGCGTDVRDAEPAHGGTVATQAVWVCTRCGVRQQEDNPPFCWGCGYGETVATQEPAVHAEEADRG